MTSHTPDERVRIARELDVMRNSHKKTEEAPKPKGPKPDMYSKDGRILQRNEGKQEFRLEETEKLVILTVKISKYLDTSLIDVDVHPTYVKVVVKGKVLQLVLDSEVVAAEAVCERSRMNGDLVVSMLKASAKTGKIEEVHSEMKEQKAAEHRDSFKQSEAPKKPVGRNKRLERLFEPNEAVDIHNIVNDNKNKRPGDVKVKVKGIYETTKAVAPKIEDEDFEDLPEVPPLC